MAINQLSTANTFQQWLIATQVLIEQSNYYESNTEIFYQTVSDTSNLANVIFANAAVVNAQTSLVLTIQSNTYDIYVDTIDVYNNTVNTYANTVNTYANTVIVAGFVTNNLAIALDAANNILSDSQNTANLINSDSLNTANIIINSANSFANTVNVTAQSAYDTANASLILSQEAANLVYEVLDDNANDTTLFVALFTSNTGTPNTAYVSSEKLYYNPSTGQLSATNFDSLSDINKKTEVLTIQNAIETVMALRGVTFKWKDTGHNSMGLIAQEVESVVPEVVITNEKGEKSVTYGSLIGLLVESIKQVVGEINEIKETLNR